MTLKAGIPLVDLFASVDQINQSLPAPLAAFFNRFVATGLESRSSASAIIHTGTLQPLIEPLTGQAVDEFDLGLGKLRLPLLTSGVPFQLSKLRDPVTDTLEPGAGAWQFDLLLDSFSLQLDGLIAADYVPAAGTSPHHLVPKEGNPLAMITGSAGVRFERANADAAVVTRFFSVQGGSDPFVPMRRSGFVSQIAMTPPHALIGTSQFGITVRSLLFDFSELTSPPIVTARGQSAAWTGLAIDEAAIYCPSNAVGRGGFSLTVRDFLIGDPLGIQGELEVQFGQSPLAPSTFVFRQNDTDISSDFDFDDGTLEISALPGEQVSLTASLTNIAPPAADSGITDWDARFDFPGQDPVEGDSATGMVRHGDVISITPIEVIGTGDDTRRIAHPAFTVRLVASGTAPTLSVDINGTTLANVIDLNGPASGIAGLVLTAQATPPDPAAVFQWRSDALGIAHDGPTLTLSPAADLRGDFLLRVVQADSDNGAAHLRLRLRDAADGGVLVGCESGVFDATDPTTAVALTEVLGTYDLTNFHTDGRLSGADGQATISGGAADVPAGCLAEVSYFEGGADEDAREDRHVQLLFAFGEDTVVGWGDARPHQAGSNFHADLLRWAANYQAAAFQVIGRCDDVGDDALNRDLAQDRAAKGVSLLTTATDGLAAAGPVTSRGEQDATPLVAGAAALITPDIAESSVRLINQIENRDRWPRRGDDSGDRLDPPDPAIEQVRRKYRRVDIYAVGGTASGAARVVLTPRVDPRQRRILVPATGRETLPASNQAARADYRVKLVLGWDRPRFTGWEDAVPNLAEFEYAWTPSADDGISIDREVLTLFGKWIYDDLTGFTQFGIGIKSEGDPDGLFRVDQDNLVAALSFGPMLASGVDFDDDAFGSSVRLGALAAIAGFAKINLGGGPLVGDASFAAFQKVEARAETRTISDPAASYKLQILFDYTTTMHINGGALGLQTDPAQPMKLRYKDIGLEFDNTDPDAPLLDKIGLAYASDSMSVEDSGLWRISGPLGQLLRISEFKFGVGSFWVEPTLAIALDLGVVEVSEAAFRVTFKTDATDEDERIKFTLRGLTAKVDIPGVVSGEGRLKIEESGVVKAAIDATLVPLQTRVVVALAVGVPDEIAPSVFMNLYARVQFPGGIPLGPLPIAIHGFIGQVVINGTRDVTEHPDVVTREIGWWRKPPEQKYKPEKDQYALGFGVVLGTLPDASFSLSVTGMVVVAFPDVEVILGVEVNLLTIPDTTARDEKEGNTASITGLVVINDEAVTIAVSAEYKIPEILEVKIPFAAYFPGSGSDTYVRLGADGVDGRIGEPITIKILPSTLNLQAWAYLMIEGGGITRLGGREGWDFPGFAIGFGTGISIGWKAGPLELSASAALYVGLGTDPLLIKGGLVVRGTLDLVVVSANVHGEITLSYLAPETGDPVLALEDARFCAEVDLFFFTVSGCIDLSFGSGAGFTPPEPDPPVTSVTLTDRLYATMGEARNNAAPQAAPLFDFIEVDGESVNQGVPPEDNHTVWPDTVPLLNFRHFTLDAMPDTAQFNPGPQPAGEAWFGSNRLRYAYRLDNVRLIHEPTGDLVTDAGGDKPMSVWTHAPSRPADDTSGSGSQVPSDAEKTHLQLLNWEPAAWMHGTESGGAGQPGDPVDTVGRICEPVPAPARACLLGGDAVVLTGQSARLRRPAPAAGPYPSRFIGRSEAFLPTAGDLSGTALLSLLNMLGATSRAGAVVATPTVQIAGQPVAQGYRLPALARVGEDADLTHVPMPWRTRLDRDVVDGELLLLLCTPDVAASEGACYSFEGRKPGAPFLYEDFPPFYARVLPAGPDDKQTPLVLADTLDNANPAGVVLGQDQRPELIIPDSGAAFDFKVACHVLALHFFRRGSEGTVTVTAYHADGSSTAHSNTGPADRPATLRITSSSGIVSIDFRTGAKAIALHSICCERPGRELPAPRRDCLDFAHLSFDLVERGSFQHDGATFTPLNPNAPLELFDAIDATLSPARTGQDGAGDLRLPDSGVRITLPAPCTHLVVGVVLGGGPVTVTGFDANGDPVTRIVSLTTQSFGQELHLVPRGAEITEITITGGSGEALLYRLCCLRAAAEPAPDARVCTNLKGLRARGLVAKLGHQGLVFRDPDTKERLELVDRISGTGLALRAGDGVPELAFSEAGLIVDLSAKAGQVDLRLHAQKGQPYRIEARDAAGDQIAVATGKMRSQTQQISVSGSGITSLLVRLDGPALLSEICVTKPAADALPATPPAQDGPTLPVVTSRDRDTDASTATWNGRIVQSFPAKDGKICYLLRYQMPRDAAPADELHVVAAMATSHDLTFLSLCGVDHRAALMRIRDTEVRADLAERIPDADASALDGRPVLLEPDTEYRIEINWSWQAWQGQSENDTPPAVPPGDGFVPAAQTQVFRFRTAPQDLTIPARQDGPNEYLFDPRDLDRYLLDSAPQTGGIAHFRNDPVVFHFSQRHIDALLAQYGRALEIDIRRTDPPPQPGGDLTAILAALVGVVGWFHGPAGRQTDAVNRYNDAVAAAPCLDAGRPLGGLTLAGRYPLEPNVMYDADLFAQNTSSAGDRVRITSVNFRSSRYADPAEMVRALGCATDGSVAPVTPSELVLDAGAVLPADIAPASDMAFDAAMAGMGLDTLALPVDAPRLFQLWRPDATGTSLQMVGLLVDALEPLTRSGAVLQGDSVEEVTRCALSHAQIDGLRFDVVRQTRNATRMLLVPAGAFTVPLDPASFRLVFDTSDGPIVGRRRLRDLPLVVELEGF